MREIVIKQFVLEIMFSPFMEPKCEVQLRTSYISMDVSSVSNKCQYAGMSDLKA